MYTYDTVVDAINGLRIRGYTVDFNIAANKLICSEKIHCLEADEFEITEVHRFEGATNPSDEDAVYAVESYNGKVKGVLTSAFGPYADNVSVGILRKLSMNT